MDEPRIKTCTKCGESKLIDNFTKDKNRKDGLDLWCRGCKREYKEANKEALGKTSANWRSNNKELISKNWATWYSNNKEARREYQQLDRRKEANRLRSAKWHAEHRDEVLATKSRYRRNNPEKHYQSFLDWKSKNPVRLAKLKKLAEIRRRDRKNNLDEHIDSNFIDTVYTKFNFKCFNCQKTEKLSIDHHYPLASGVPLLEQNAVLLCSKCNSSKGPKDPSKFYEAGQLVVLHEQYGILCPDDDLLLQYYSRLHYNSQEHSTTEVPVSDLFTSTY